LPKRPKRADVPALSPELEQHFRDSGVQFGPDRKFTDSDVIDAAIKSGLFKDESWVLKDNKHPKLQRVFRGNIGALDRFLAILESDRYRKTLGSGNEQRGARARAKDEHIRAIAEELKRKRPVLAGKRMEEELARRVQDIFERLKLPVPSTRTIRRAITGKK
jgi:hypothetical protein